MHEDQKRETNTFNFSSAKGFCVVFTNSGKNEEFRTWKDKYEVFLGSEFPKFIDFLKKIEDQDDEITNSDLDLYPHADPKEVEYMNEQLYNVLAMNLQDAPLALVKNLREEARPRGANGW